MQKKEEKNLGNIKLLSLNITKPLPMKAIDMEFNALTLLCGKNGAGKTFVQVVSFCMTCIANTIVLVGDAVSLKEVTQMTFDRSFNDQDIDGTITGKFNSKFELTITFETGKVVDVKYISPEPVTQPSSVLYLSSNFRLFESISHYLKFRKIIKITSKNTDELMDELTKNFKLYDVMFLERMIMSSPIKFNKENSEILKKDFEITNNIKSVIFDEDKDDFYYEYIEKDKEGKEIEKKMYLTKLSRGHQSILNMIIGTILMGG